MIERERPEVDFSRLMESSAAHVGQRNEPYVMP
jgi:hypothetical protein